MHKPCIHHARQAIAASIALLLELAHAPLTHAHTNLARSHATAHESRAPKLRIIVEGNPPRVFGKLDGNELSSLALTHDIAVAPGEHDLELAAPGKALWHQPRLWIAASGATVLRVSLADGPAPSGALPLPDQRSRAWRYFVGGAGIVALGTGVGFLLRARALDAKSESEASTARLFNPPSPTLGAAALGDHHAAVRNQTAGLILAGAGVAGVGTGIYLLIAPPTPRSIAGFRFAPDVVRGGGGVKVSGRF